jgi:GT2 family glycosyltransferase
MKKFELHHLDYDKAFQAPYIHGCFMLLRTEALKRVGLFDERFFMYPEDIDLTRRIYSHYKTMYNPAVEIVHEHEKGSYKSFRLLGIHLVNMVKYFNKWGWFFDKERSIINKRTLEQLQ